MFTSLTKLLLKAILVLVLVVALTALALHIWFVNNARGIMKQIVTEKSHGKFRLELSRLSFDFLSNTLQVQHADLSSTDSTTQPTTYHVKFNRLTLHVGSFWPLLLKKDLMLDSIILQDPQIEVRRWRKETSGIFSNEELSVPQEMGRMYHSMLDVLETFGIRRIKINNATLSLRNKMEPKSLPVAISNIYLDLVKTPNKSVKAGGEADQSQSIDLLTREQNISLPGGRHKLAFKNFHLQLFRKRIQLDSCTITAVTTDSARSSYKIFFKTLMLTGVDFDAMYRRNVIKADSVYCESPLFDIRLDKQKSGVTTKQRPDAEKIIRELTGDLDLAFVGVKSAGIRINMRGGTRRSLYNSNKDDFEMYGLKVNSDSAMPVSVDRFEMLVRDYHLYNQDSSATYSFDSIHFVNNKIRLSNFSALTGQKHNNLHNERDFKIARFELTGLDWYELVFNETVKAREAYLYNPVIKYKKRKPNVAGKKSNLFSALQSVDDFMTLDKITVVNGVLNMDLSQDLSFDLNKVNFSLYSNKLLKSIDKEGIRDAVEYFVFEKGLLRLRNFDATLNNVEYSSDNLLHAADISVKGKQEQLTADAHDVYIGNVFIDERGETIIVDGVRWNRAALHLQPMATSGVAVKKRAVVLKNIAGNNTDLTYTGTDVQLSSFVRSFSFSEFSNTQSVHVSALNIEGDRLQAIVKTDTIVSAGYRLSDNAPSFFSALRANKFGVHDSIYFQASKVSFVPDINSIFSKNVKLQNLFLESPVFKSVSWKSDIASEPTKKSATAFHINEVRATHPDVSVRSYRNDSSTIINIPHTAASELEVAGVSIDSSGVAVKMFSFKTGRLSLTTRAGDDFQLEEGKMQVQLNDLHFAAHNGKPAWEGVVNNFYLSNPKKINLGKKRKAFYISEANLGNIHLSSAYLSDPEQLIQKNLSAWLSKTTGEYTDSVNTFKWYNAGFNGGRLTLDSFDYHPTPERDQLLSSLNYQKDFITFHSGPVLVAGFKPEQYRRDSAIIADTVHITQPLITIFRDKLPPFAGGKIKPLPVDMLKNISRPIDVNTIILDDGELSYTERNAKSRAEGTITLKQMEVLLGQIKNRNIHQTDSLLINMSALLMDSAMINVRVKESYTDSLSGFRMTLRMKPTSLLFLNPVLTPLSNVKIVSGNVDSLFLDATGKEYLAFGKMNMYYKNLKIQIVKDGNPDKVTFGNKLVSFFANSFIIKSYNNGRTGLVYFERLRDRSFFNYIIKMTFSGMATSIGVKKNRKYLKQYNKQIKARGLQEQ